MLGSATTTIVMSSRSMNVVVQTATSVQRRLWAEASIRLRDPKRKGPAQRRPFQMTRDDETAQGPFRTRGMGRWVALGIGRPTVSLSPSIG